MTEVLWTEKYRPTKIEECVLPEAIKTTFQRFVKEGTLPNLLLTGGPGVGKTTVALAAVEELGSDALVINASLSGNIDTLRNEVTQFAATVSLKGTRKYVILDEADYLNPNSTQPSLRNFIETYSKNCGFILTCNYPQRIIEPLKSRLVTVSFDTPYEEQPKIMLSFMKRAKQILEAEGVEYDKDTLGHIVSRGFPDWRRVINDLQYFAGHGKIDPHVLTQRKTEIGNLIDAMRAKSFDKVMEWVRENAAELDHVGLIRTLYDETKTFMTDSNSIASMIVIMGRYQHQAAHVADLEINTAAMLIEITAECKFT